MTDDRPSDRPNDLFLGLVASLQMSAWMSLGKVMNPMSQKVERNLPQAKDTIDVLGALEQKTRGNLHSDEERLLGRILYELRLNYVDELKSEAGVTPDAAPPLQAPASAPPESPPPSA